MKYEALHFTLCEWWWNITRLDFMIMMLSRSCCSSKANEELVQGGEGQRKTPTLKHLKLHNWCKSHASKIHFCKQFFLSFSSISVLNSLNLRAKTDPKINWNRTTYKIYLEENSQKSQKCANIFLIFFKKFNKNRKFGKMAEYFLNFFKKKMFPYLL